MTYPDDGGSGFLYNACKRLQFAVSHLSRRLFLYLLPREHEISQLCLMFLRGPETNARKEMVLSFQELQKGNYGNLEGMCLCRSCICSLEPYIKST